MRDLVRKYVDAGRDAIGGDRVEDLARDVRDWSRRNATRLAELVRREVRRQLRTAGAATQEEVSELRARVRALERQVAGGKGPTSAKTTAARRAPTKKAGRKKSAGKKPAAKKAAPKRSASRVPPE